MKISAKTSFYAGSVAFSAALAAAVIALSGAQQPTLPVVQLDPIVIVGHKDVAEMPLVRLEPMIIVGHSPDPAQLAMADGMVHARATTTN